MTRMARFRFPDAVWIILCVHLFTTTNGIVSPNSAIECQQGFSTLSWFKNGIESTVCIRLFSNSQSWQEAENTCRNYSSHLPAVPTLPSNGSAIIEFVEAHNFSSNVVWLGLRRKANYFQWIGEKPSVPEVKSDCSNRSNSNGLGHWGLFWEPRKLSDDCAMVVIRTGKRRTKQCSHLTPFMCINEIPTKKLLNSPICQKGSKYSVLAGVCVSQDNSNGIVHLCANKEPPEECITPREKLDQTDVKVIVEAHPKDFVLTTDFNGQRLICKVMIRNKLLNSSATKDFRYSWIKDGVYLDAYKKTLYTNDIYDRTKQNRSRIYAKVGSYQCEVQIPGAIHSFRSEEPIIIGFSDALSFNLSIETNQDGGNPIIATQSTGGGRGNKLTFDPQIHDFSCWGFKDFSQNLERVISSLKNSLNFSEVNVTWHFHGFEKKSNDQKAARVKIFFTPTVPCKFIFQDTIYQVLKTVLEQQRRSSGIAIEVLHTESNQTAAGSCPGNQTQIPITLEELAQETYTEQNKSTVIKDLRNLTSPENLDAAGIQHTVTILEKISNFSTFHKEDTLNILSTVDNLMDVDDDVLKPSLTKNNASSRIVASIETLLLKGTISEDISFTYRSRKLAMVTRRGSSDVIYGAAAVQSDSDPRLSIREFSNEMALQETEKSWKAAVSLPKNFVRSAASQGNLNISLLVYESGKLFVTKRSVTGPVILVLVSSQIPNVNLDPPVQLIFDDLQHSKFRNRSRSGNPTCVYWAPDVINGGKWLNDGCKYNGTVNGKHVCLCNHLTHFGVLFDYYGQEAEIKGSHGLALEMITYIGCGLSILGLTFTIIIHVSFKKVRKGNGSHTLCNLAVALLGLTITFLAGIDRVHWTPGCILVAILLHYFTLVSFAWMLVEGVLQYLKFVKVIGTYIPNFMLKAVICAWGVPLIVVGVMLAIDYRLYSGGKEYCWMNTNASYFAVILPAGAALLTNILLFVIVVYSITCGRQRGLRTNQNERKMIVARLRASVCIGILLGLTWVFAFLSIGKARLVFTYLFSIFSTLQGFFIFVFLVVTEKSCKEFLQTILHCKKEDTVLLTTKDSTQSSSVREQIL